MHWITSWLDDAETFKVTMSAIHDGAAVLIDALDAAMSGEPPALAASPGAPVRCRVAAHRPTNQRPATLRRRTR